MKKSLLFLLVAITSCSKNQDQPEQFFSPEQQSQVLKQVVHYSSKLPPNATHTNKFDTAFDWYYNAAAKECDIRKLKLNKDSTFYFLITRKARSIWPAREGIGGKLKVNRNFQLEDYEETFRTWKMTEDSLNNRAFELFDKMVQGKDLTPYYSKNKGDRYIEFPDDRWYFNKQEKKWRDKMADSLQIQ
jgi:hypothetical protein